MKNINLKKGQISIYLLIGIVILFILIFLIFADSDNKVNNLEQAESKIEPLNEETLLVKTRVDYCLNRELKRSLIIAGLRGGYIYDKGEYSLGGIIPQNTYSPQLISNLDLNWNTLQSKVIVYSNEIPTPAEIENNTLKVKGEYVFNQTAKSDFEKFIKSNFLKCLNFNDLQDKYEFNYSDYYGNVININYPNNELIISQINAQIEDSIQIDLENQDIIGKVIEELPNNEFKVKFSNLEKLQNEKITTLENLNVINLDSNFEINVNFNYEDVTLKAYFPVTIKDKDSISTFKETTIKLDVRFKALLEFAKELISTKYYREKNIDYSNPDDVYRALNKSEYFKTTKLKRFTISKKTIKNEDEHKQFVYSIIDSDSKINGNPFVFNFGYENEAPTVNFKTINPSFQIDNQTTIISLIATKGDEIKYELRKHTKEKQLYDEHIFYFEPQEYIAADATFKLTQNGSLYFKPEKEKLYTYPIKVTDGETIREHILIFITGFPDNNNNTAAKECFKFKNYEDLDNLFPISNSFKNKIFTYETQNYQNVFALSPYYLNSAISYPTRAYESEIYFAKSCVYNTDFYSIRAFKSDPSGTKSEINSNNILEDDRYFKIKVPMEPFTQKFTIEILSNSEGTIMTEPFNISIYPASCLGPEPFQTELNATCCDTQTILNKINLTIKEANPSYLDFITTSSIKNNQVIFNENIYACYDFRAIPNTENNLFNYEQNNIWENINNKITSLFETNLEIKCQGKYPHPIQNINSLNSQGGENFGTLAGIKTYLNENNNVNKISVSLKQVSSSDKCEFCFLDEKKDFSIITSYKGKKLIFNLGSKNVNSNQVYTMPQTQEYSNVNILCDSSWYASNKQNPFANSDWQKITSNFGENNQAEPLHISLGYCYQGTNSCAGKTNSANSESKFDSRNDCVDYYFSESLPIKMKPNTGWQCSTDKTCNNGLCK